MIPKLLAGDIILSRQDKFFSRVIRWFGKQKTGEAGYSHAAMALGELTLEPAVIESLFRVVQSPLTKYEGQEIVVYRMKSIDQMTRNRIAARALSVSNEGYGVLKIPLFAMDSVFKTYWFTSTFGVSSFKVCSNLIAWSYEKVLSRLPFGIGWRSVSPDGIDDMCRISHEWEKIYETD